MATISDPRAEAMEYLNQHKVIRLFEILGAKLAYLKPEDPNGFLAAELSKISAMQSRGQPVTIFSEQDLDVMFTVFDITNRGYLTQQQYASALLAVGIEGGVAQCTLPIGDMIDKKQFVACLLAEVNKSAF